jgi:hypothetical protein
VTPEQQAERVAALEAERADALALENALLRERIALLLTALERVTGIDWSRVGQERTDRPTCRTPVLAGRSRRTRRGGRPR